MDKNDSLSKSVIDELFEPCSCVNKEDNNPSDKGVMDMRPITPPSFGGIEFDSDKNADPVVDPKLERSMGVPDWTREVLKIRNRIENLGLSENVEESNSNEIEQTPLPENIKVGNKSTLIGSTDASNRVILKKDANTYQLEKYRKNAMIIFNHKNFLGNHEVRKYTTKDEEALKATFEKFGFIVESFLDLRKKELIQELKSFCSKDFSDYGCVCAAIMTHGSRKGNLRAHDIRYSEHEFIACFNAESNHTLLGKPIIILIQACRGDDPANAVDPTSPISEKQIEFDSDDHYTLPTEADMLIFHSSYVGRASASSCEGSWFIQTLCNEINSFAAVDDFETICRTVKKKVAIDKHHEMFWRQKNIVVKQMPVVTSTLMRLLLLRRYGEIGEVDGICLNTRNMRVSETINLVTQIRPEIRVDACACIEYFDYLKRCLRFFINENNSDGVAESILKLADNDQYINGEGAARADMMSLIRNYLSSNIHRFTSGEVVYLGRSCCCSARSNIIVGTSTSG